MVVEVRLFATFREGRFDTKKLELPEGSSLSVLLEHLKIPDKLVKVLIVNGLSATTEHILNHNDVVAIFPPIAGG